MNVYNVSNDLIIKMDNNVIYVDNESDKDKYKLYLLEGNSELFSININSEWQRFQENNKLLFNIEANDALVINNDLRIVLNGCYDVLSNSGDIFIVKRWLLWLLIDIIH